jgi:DNA-binding LacI/PurR family transcriptional regulator/signal transduction histidine kinase
MIIKGRRPRQTLGVLTGGGHVYNTKVWGGIVEIAQNQGVNVIGFDGLSVQGQGDYTVQANIIYELVNEKNIDGLIINSSSVFNYISLAESVVFLAQYSYLPMISIGRVIPEIPSIIIDNHKSVYDLVNHLINVHGRRHIAFINGPEQSIEAQTRYKAYVAALSSHNMAVDANLVVPGDFYYREGLKAIELLTDERKVKFDAIVSANDNIALGAMEALRLRGIHVPRDVSVIGFDDIPQGEYTVPPLSTIQQPMMDLGRISAINLLALINGEEVLPVTQVPTIPVIRQSCGCPSPQVERTWANHSINLTSNLKKTPAFEDVPRSRILREMGETLPLGRQAPSLLSSQVLDAFLEALIQEEPEIFLEEWSHVLRQTLFAHQDVFCWQGALSILRQELLPFVTHTEIFPLADNLWHQARVLLAEVVQQASMQQETEERRNTILLQETNQKLLMTFDMEELLDFLANLLPQLGLNCCFLCLYDKQVSDELIHHIPDWLRLIMAYDENGRLPVPDVGLRFPSTQLTPDNLTLANKRRDMLMIPLYIRENQLGFGLFEMDYPDRQLYDLLSHQISNAIHGALLIQQVRQAHAKLEQRVEERTQELELRNAELERFTYTVSHDLKSPLITIQGFLGFLERDAVAGDIIRIKEDVARITDATNRMRVLLDELLELSRVGRLVNPSELVPLTELVEEAISLVAGRIKARGVQVVVAPNLPVVYGDRRRLVEVMQNLLDNAVKFMGQQPKPRVEIGGNAIENEILCYVRDNGVGIKPQYYETVFGLFDRLDPSIEGTGIGLALVKRIIEVHNGRIWVESDGKYKGTSFYFSLPGSPEMIQE